MVIFFEMCFRGGDAMGPGIVIGKEEEAFTGFVQPPYGREMWQIRTLETFINRGAAFLITGGGDESTGLIEHDVNRLRCREGCATDLDDVVIEKDWMLGIPADAAIQGDLTGTNEGKTLAAGAVTQFGKGAGEACA